MPTTPLPDLNRLRRAATRRVRRIGERRYLVEGRVFPSYVVDLGDEGSACRCADAQFRRGPCLHELAARLHDGDGALILSLGRMLAAAEQAVKAPRRSWRAVRGSRML